MEDNEYIYFPGISGEIELIELDQNLKILKIYFRKLSLRENPGSWYETSTEVMLTNYPVTINRLEQLNGKTIEIPEGWTDKAYFTMLSVWDGEPINGSKISFELKDNGIYHITWTGFWGQHKDARQKISLDLAAYPTTGIITPLCLRDSELIDIFRSAQK